MRFGRLGVCAVLVMWLAAWAGCARPSEHLPLAPPGEGQQDLSAHVAEHYQADVDKAFQWAEARGLGRFVRLRLEMTVDGEGHVGAARVAVAENWNRRVLGALERDMQNWAFPKTGQPYTRIVELVRSIESLRRRQKSFRIAR